jgi:hypothetical protein
MEELVVVSNATVRQRADIEYDPSYLEDWMGSYQPYTVFDLTSQVQGDLVDGGMTVLDDGAGSNTTSDVVASSGTVALLDKDSIFESAGLVIDVGPVLIELFSITELRIEAEVAAINQRGGQCRTWQEAVLRVGLENYVPFYDDDYYYGADIEGGAPSDVVFTSSVPFRSSWYTMLCLMVAAFRWAI